MHSNILLTILISLITFIPLVSCNTIYDDPEIVSLSPGDRLPEFSILCNDGEVLTTEMLRGKRSVIVFFDTSCPDCQKALPEIQKAYDEDMSRQPDGVRYICISRNEDAESVKKYWSDHSYTLPYSAQTSADVYNLFANIGIPRIYISNSALIIEKVYE